METIENRTVNDSVWESLERMPINVKEKLNSKGYKEMGTGIFVAEEDAYAYALERVSLDEDLQKEFTEWFYSGNWIKED